MRNLGVRVERADVRWVGVRRKKSTQVFWGAVCWVWLAPSEVEGELGFSVGVR